MLNLISLLGNSLKIPYIIVDPIGISLLFFKLHINSNFGPGYKTFAQYKVYLKLLTQIVVPSIKISKLRLIENQYLAVTHYIRHSIEK